MSVEVDLTLESDANERAVEKVAELLGDSKSLDMIEQHIYRMRRKKQMVETSLKNAVETQLTGVKSGLLILRTVLQDADEICNTMKDVNNIYSGLAGELKDNMNQIRETRVTHKEHALLNNYLQSIYGFKQDVERAKNLLVDDELLEAHGIIMNLDDCRDGIYKEVMNERVEEEKKTKVEEFFKGLDELNEEMTKKIQFFVSKALDSIRSGSTSKLVSILRIIEREERKDALIMDVMATSTKNRIYRNRPKQWKQKALLTIANVTSETFEGFWGLDQSNSTWILKFVQKIKSLTENDLKVVYQHLQYCFPPHWNILEFYCGEYQNHIRSRLTKIINSIKSSKGEASSYIIVFNWANVLNSIINTHRPKDKREDTLTPDDINVLVKSYVERLEVELQRQTENILKQERDARYAINKAPDSDPKSGHYYTTTPVIFYEMINQNMEFAFKLSKLEVIDVLDNLDKKIDTFVRRYVEQLREFKERYFSAESDLQREDMQYVEWLIAACNNAVKCAHLNDELISMLKDKSDSLGGDILSKHGIADKTDLFLSTLLEKACGFIAELIFTELKDTLDNIYSGSWSDKQCLVTVATIDDYTQDYLPLIVDEGQKKLLEVLASRLLAEYLVRLFNTKSLTISTDQFRDRLIDDQRRIEEFFVKTLKMDDSFPLGDYEALKVVAELVSDTEDLVEISMADCVNKYPDIMYDQCVALLALRGDMNGKDIRDMVTRNNITELNEHRGTTRETVFTRVHQITGPLSSRFFQTVIPSITRGSGTAAPNLNTSVSSVAGSTSLSKVTDNISNAISNSPVYNSIKQAWNDKDQIAGKLNVARALEYSGNASPETEQSRSNPFDDPREGKGRAPRPPAQRQKGPAPPPPKGAAAPPSKGRAPPPPVSKSTNPFEDESD